VAHYRYESGKPPRVTYYEKQCPRCGRYRNDASRRRGYFDGRYERD
jgi:hypothetical protein